MSIFKELEKRLENLFEGFFNERFSSALQPVELAKKLVAEMDRKRQISVTLVYAPNKYEVALSVADLAELGRFKESLSRELIGYLAAHAHDKNYSLTGALEILFVEDGRLKSGDCRVEGHVEESSAPPIDRTQIISVEEIEQLLDTPPKACLEDASTYQTYLLRSRSITIGRQAGNDIVLSAPGVSRRHARLEADSETYRLIDLGSTNGSYVNDEEVDEALLADGDLLSIGDITLRFRLKQ